jgi:hypothetical protein
MFAVLSFLLRGARWHWTLRSADAASVLPADDMGIAMPSAMPELKIFQFPADHIPRIDGNAAVKQLYRRIGSE